MYAGPGPEKFNIVSNDYGRMQKCNFCVCLKRKMLCICQLSPYSSRIRTKKYFTDRDTANKIHGSGDSVLVSKIHYCYCRIRKSFRKHSILSHSSDVNDYNGQTTDENKPFQNAYLTYLALDRAVLLTKIIRDLSQGAILGILKAFS